ncbi:hypothetical protein N185_08530 [Sinorhizobium sp. GW3]|nr:hypothetical protein N185_08530 [Sinorhizobium sp. GW3]
MFVMSLKAYRIGILAHEFLINIGANDLLRNILRGLSHRSETEIFFLCPPLPTQEENLNQDALRAAYSLYAEVAPRMRFIPCVQNPFEIRLAINDHKLDVVMPSIHVLPEDFNYISYWPDCQPKHLPEFFDDASQQARDSMISGLLATGRPMIINSRDAKKDMTTFYGANPEQIFDLPFAPLIDAETLFPRPELKADYDISSPFFLVSNQWWLHKSIQTVFEALKILKNKGLSCQVVFTGRMQEPRRPSYIDELHAMIPALGLEDHVRLLGYIPKRNQLELMKWATAVIQPTLFEGGPGGGSVYDAVSLGKRAIVTDLPVNRELPPNGLIAFFPPRSAAHLATLMEAALAAPHRAPPPEELYQQSRDYTVVLSKRLYQAIDRATQKETRASHVDHSGAALTLAEAEWREVVRLAYQVHLRRAPSEADYVVWSLDEWSSKHENLVSAMLHAVQQSKEAVAISAAESGPRGAFQSLYQAALGRTPNPSELDPWCGELKKGRTFRSLALEILNSEEACRKAGVANAEFGKLIPEPSRSWLKTVLPSRKRSAKPR